MYMCIYVCLSTCSYSLYYNIMCSMNASLCRISATNNNIIRVTGIAIHAVYTAVQLHSYKFMAKLDVHVSRMALCYDARTHVTPFLNFQIYSCTYMRYVAATNRQTDTHTHVHTNKHRERVP